MEVKEKLTDDEVLEFLHLNQRRWIPHHRCGGCNEMVGFNINSLDPLDLDFSGDCNCVTYRSQPSPRNIGDLTHWYNIQSSDEARLLIIENFKGDARF